MSLHKLTAGSGYDYLTRQVAALDATGKGHTGLASYYAERGESPGVWIGSGYGRDRRNCRWRPGDRGADAGPVWLRSAPVGRAPAAAAGRTRPHPWDFQAVTRLGVPFRIVDDDLSPFRLEVAKRIVAINTAIGRPAGAPLAAADRARVRTEVAREFFLAEHGREPIDARDWRDRSRKTLGREPRPLPGMT